MQTYKQEIQNGMARGLGLLFFQVREFHLTFGHPAPTRPTLLPPERVAKRREWIMEESKELHEATSIVDQTDAFIDLIYFAVGGLVEMGVSPAVCWNLVQRANMAKLWPDGTVHRRPEDGKVMKPPGWVEPTIAMQAEIVRQATQPQSCVEFVLDRRVTSNVVTQNEPGGLPTAGAPEVPWTKQASAIAIHHPEKGIVGYVAGPLEDGDTVMLEPAWVR